MILGQITEVIMTSCFSLECLQETEDYVLENLDLFSDAELKCVYTMLEVRNKILYDEKIVRKKIYKD